MTEVRRYRLDVGFTIVELCTVMALSAILCAVAIPQMVAQRRLMRSSTVTREIMTQLRYARQLAMSNRQAYTFQYDNNTNNKFIRVIGPIPAGTIALADVNYPSNNGSAVLLTVPLAQSGLNISELNEGVPTASTGLSAGDSTPPTLLGDKVTKTALVNEILNITFQPDGTVIDTAGAPADKALFFFNNKAAKETASAISVLGASGRVKVWRYTTNGNKYAE
jgi:Tfp pilus assembly protein FimT